MTLVPGSRLGPYEITAAIGAGGMGEVYRAHDTKLNRDVAIKVLPEAFAYDHERLARFTREAQTLASLNHPNIAAIHGIEEVPAVSGSGPGSRALVMELVEGEDLSIQIARGPIPMAEALPIARQIAEALEAAHENGMVHRDLKPANIKVRSDGTVKVLDFGLAKAMDSAVATNPDVSHSPTLTGHGTQMGLIIGTAAYMSPEQAKGKVVDRRADIWAFGVVLYEMLTGTRAFKGEDVSETLASVLKDPLSMEALPSATPPRLSRLIERCLDRDLKTRLRDVGEARIKIARIESGVPDALVSSAPEEGLGRQTARPWILATATFGIALVAALLAWEPWRPVPEVRQMRFFVSLPDGRTLTTLGPQTGATGAAPGPLAISPDGRQIAFLANVATGRSRLWVRPLDTLAARELPGTDGASRPFWSPDSRSLGFYSDGKVKRVDVSGGLPLTLCDSPDWRGGTWSPDGVIVFSPGATSALQKVSAAGGVPVAATVLGEGESGHGLPLFLPDGRRFAHWVYGLNSIYVASLDSADRTLLLKNPDAQNVRFAEGRLLFMRGTSLMAQPLDPGRLTLTGEPAPIADQIQTLGSPPLAVFGTSDTGVLAYQTGMETGKAHQLTWFDRTGKPLGLVEKPGSIHTVAISPDGTRVAFARSDSQAMGGGGEDLWVHEFARHTSTRLTFDPARDRMAAWSPDGSRIVWSSNRDGNHNLYQKVSNGAGNDEVLLKSGDANLAYDWSSDARFLLYGSVPKGGSGGRSELWVLPLAGNDGKPTPYVQLTGFFAEQARFSPDGRFVAYASNASGRQEVYVQPFPEAAGGKWMVSQGGGVQPRWRRDGKELFYISLDTKIMAVPVATTPAFTPGAPKELFAAPVFGGSTTGSGYYDVTADGQRFLIAALPSEMAAAAAPPITVVLNWNSVLKN